MKKILLSLFLASTIYSAHADVLKVTLNLSGVDTFTVRANVLEGVQSSVKGNFTMQGVLDGQTLDMSLAIPSTPSPNTTTMILIDKKQLRFKETVSGIDTVTKAKIKKSFRGNLKSVTIDREDFLAMMKPIFEKQGLDGLQNLDIKVDDTQLSTSIETSDYECSRVEGELHCESSAKIMISIKQ